MVGDFNEDVNAKNIQEFMVEMGLYEVFREVHEVNDNDKDGTFEYGTKCADNVLCRPRMKFAWICANNAVAIDPTILKLIIDHWMC